MSYAGVSLMSKAGATEVNYADASSLIDAGVKLVSYVGATLMSYERTILVIYRYRHALLEPTQAQQLRQNCKRYCPVRP